MKARLFVTAAAAAIALIPSPALAWGKTGHRVVAAIADTQLSGLARAHIEEILGSARKPRRGRELAGRDAVGAGAILAEDRDAVALCDAQRRSLRPCAVGGRRARGAAALHARRLRDPNASLADKQLALRFIVHLVGDLHQPLHVGKCCDRGGNDVKVNWFGKPTNLHAVWDSQLVDEEQLSFTELDREARAAHQQRRRDRLVGHQSARLDQRERARSATRVYPATPPQGRQGQEG